MDLPHTPLSKIIDPIIGRIGELVSWLWLVLLVVIVLNVTLRYFFGEGRVEFEEVQWHLYSIGFLFGLSYAYASDSHIRVDVLRGWFHPRINAWIELYGIVFLLLPLIALVLIFGTPFVLSSFQLGEVSQAPGGLAYRWAIKAALPVGFSLLLVSTVSRLSRVWAFLFFEGRRRGV